VLSVDCLLLFNECMQCFFKISSRRGEHKEVHILENFENYGGLEMMVVKFVHYCYHSYN
jgi:hypothetical protein